MENNTLNVGLDYGLFNNRLTGSVDLYKRTTKDLLLNTFNPSFFGFQTKTITMLEIYNKGIELLVEVIAIRTNNRVEN
jgi:iron complex outermembrane receptor protein